MSERIINVHNWIIKIINSCTHPEHLIVCNEMVAAFARVYGANQTLVELLQNEIRNREQRLLA
jgi:hypothetical protein